jgi:putative endonuclease
MQKYYVYFLLCADDTYYIGVTNDYERRYMEHETMKKETAYTASRLPVKLVYLETHLYINNAIERETNLKKWSHAKKTALINGDMRSLKTLSKKKNWHRKK